MGFLGLIIEKKGIKMKDERRKDKKSIRLAKA